MHWFSSSQPRRDCQLDVISFYGALPGTLNTGGATEGSIEAGGKARGKIGATAPSQCASPINAVNVQRRGRKLTA
jgi:hypothetical protein